MWTERNRPRPQAESEYETTPKLRQWLGWYPRVLPHCFCCTCRAMCNKTMFLQNTPSKGICTTRTCLGTCNSQKRRKWKAVEMSSGSRALFWRSFTKQRRWTPCPRQVFHDVSCYALVLPLNMPLFPTIKVISSHL